MTTRNGETSQLIISITLSTIKSHRAADIHELFFVVEISKLVVFQDDPSFNFHYETPPVYSSLI